MLFNRCIVYLKYSCTKKRAKNVQKRVKTCKNVHLKYSFIKKTCKNVQNRAKLCKNVHLKYFWTQFKNVHLRGPCSLRPCISRPYCTMQCFDFPSKMSTSCVLLVSMPETKCVNSKLFFFSLHMIRVVT